MSEIRFALISCLTCMSMTLLAHKACNLLCKLLMHICVCGFLSNIPVVSLMVFHLFYLRGRPFSLPPLFANRSLRLKYFPERRKPFVSSSQLPSSFFKSWNAGNLKVYNPCNYPSKHTTFQSYLQPPANHKCPAKSASGQGIAGVTCQWWYSFSNNPPTWGGLRSPGKPGKEDRGKYWQNTRQLLKFKLSMCNAVCIWITCIAMFLAHNLGTKEYVTSACMFYVFSVVTVFLFGIFNFLAFN